MYSQPCDIYDLQSVCVCKLSTRGCDFYKSTYQRKSNKPFCEENGSCCSYSSSSFEQGGHYSSQQNLRRCLENICQEYYCQSCCPNQYFREIEYHCPLPRNSSMEDRTHYERRPSDSKLNLAKACCHQRICSRTSVRSNRHCTECSHSRDNQRHSDVKDYIVSCLDRNRICDACCSQTLDNSRSHHHSRTDYLEKPVCHNHNSTCGCLNHSNSISSNYCCDKVVPCCSSKAFCDNAPSCCGVKKPRERAISSCSSRKSCIISNNDSYVRGSCHRAASTVQVNRVVGIAWLSKHKGGKGPINLVLDFDQASKQLISEHGSGSISAESLLQALPDQPIQVSTSNLQDTGSTSFSEKGQMSLSRHSRSVDRDNYEERRKSSLQQRHHSLERTKSPLQQEERSREGVQSSSMQDRISEGPQLSLSRQSRRSNGSKLSQQRRLSYDQQDQDRLEENYNLDDHALQDARDMEGLPSSSSHRSGNSERTKAKDLEGLPSSSSHRSGNSERKKTRDLEELPSSSSYRSRTSERKDVRDLEGLPSSSSYRSRSSERKDDRDLEGLPSPSSYRSRSSERKDARNVEELPSSSSYQSRSSERKSARDLEELPPSSSHQSRSSERKEEVPDEKRSHYSSRYSSAGNSRQRSLHESNSLETIEASQPQETKSTSSYRRYNSEGNRNNTTANTSAGTAQPLLSKQSKSLERSILSHESQDLEGQGSLGERKSCLSNKYRRSVSPKTSVSPETCSSKKRFSVEQASYNFEDDILGDSPELQPNPITERNKSTGSRENREFETDYSPPDVNSLRTVEKVDGSHSLRGKSETSEETKYSQLEFGNSLSKEAPRDLRSIAESNRLERHTPLLPDETRCSEKGKPSTLEISNKLKFSFEDPCVCPDRRRVSLPQEQRVLNKARYGLNEDVQDDLLLSDEHTDSYRIPSFLSPRIHDAEYTSSNLEENSSKKSYPNDPGAFEERSNSERHKSASSRETRGSEKSRASYHLAGETSEGSRILQGSYNSERDKQSSSRGSRGSEKQQYSQPEADYNIKGDTPDVFPLADEDLISDKNRSLPSQHSRSSGKYAQSPLENTTAESPSVVNKNPWLPPDASVFRCDLRSPIAVCSRTGTSSYKPFTTNHQNSLSTLSPLTAGYCQPEICKTIKSLRGPTVPPKAETSYSFKPHHMYKTVRPKQCITLCEVSLEPISYSGPTKHSAGESEPTKSSNRRVCVIKRTSPTSEEDGVVNTFPCQPCSHTIPESFRRPHNRADPNQPSEKSPPEKSARKVGLLERWFGNVSDVTLQYLGACYQANSEKNLLGPDNTCQPPSKCPGLEASRSSSDRGVFMDGSKLEASLKSSNNKPCYALSREESAIKSCKSPAEMRNLEISMQSHSKPLFERGDKTADTEASPEPDKAEAHEIPYKYDRYVLLEGTKTEVSSKAYSNTPTTEPTSKSRKSPTKMRSSEISAQSYNKPHSDLDKTADSAALSEFINVIDLEIPEKSSDPGPFRRDSNVEPSCSESSCDVSREEPAIEPRRSPLELRYLGTSLKTRERTDFDKTIDSADMSKTYKVKPSSAPYSNEFCYFTYPVEAVTRNRFAEPTKDHELRRRSQKEPKSRLSEDPPEWQWHKSEPRGRSSPPEKRSKYVSCNCRTAPRTRVSPVRSPKSMSSNEVTPSGSLGKAVQCASIQPACRDSSSFSGSSWLMTRAACSAWCTSTVSFIKGSRISQYWTRTRRRRSSTIMSYCRLFTRPDILVLLLLMVLYYILRVSFIGYGYGSRSC